MPRLETAFHEMRQRHARALVGGACAELADRFGLPIWLIRVAVLVAFANAPWMTAIGYLIVAIGLRTRLADLLPARPSPGPRAWRDSPPDPGHGLQHDRFSALEARLARLEAAVTSDELKLRASFRDIGG